MANIFRIELPSSKMGFYSNVEFFENQKNKTLSKINSDVEKLIRRIDVSKNPTPTEDFYLTHNHKHHSCDNDDQWEEVFKFNLFFESQSTKYGCDSISKIALNWLGANKSLYLMLAKLGYQLVEYFVEDSYCYFMKNQVMYNSNVASKVKTYHLVDVLSKELKDETI